MTELSNTTAENQGLRLQEYRETNREKVRTADLLSLLPRGRASVLDVGARDGHFSKLLTGYFSQVTALDLAKPTFAYPGVTAIQGDATNLAFPDQAFDCVFCAEVLEHIPKLQDACRELSRVTRHELVIGVPFKQDTRAGRTTCAICKRANPPWGHVNTFDEKRLLTLFSGMNMVRKSLVGKSKDSTNWLSTVLMDWGSNPWGPYNQDEPCIYCNSKLISPRQRSFLQRGCSTAAARINGIQRLVAKPHAQWIHAVFSRGI